MAAVRVFPRWKTKYLKKADVEVIGTHGKEEFPLDPKSDDGGAMLKELKPGELRKRFVWFLNDNQKKTRALAYWLAPDDKGVVKLRPVPAAMLWRFFDDVAYAWDEYKAEDGPPMVEGGDVPLFDPRFVPYAKKKGTKADKAKKKRLLKIVAETDAAAAAARARKAEEDEDADADADADAVGGDVEMKDVGASAAPTVDKVLGSTGAAVVDYKVQLPPDVDKAAPKPKAKPKAKSEAKPKAKASAKPKAKAAAKPKAKTETKTKAASRSPPEVKEGMVHPDTIKDLLETDEYRFLAPFYGGTVSPPPVPLGTPDAARSSSLAQRVVEGGTPEGLLFLHNLVVDPVGPSSLRPVCRTWREAGGGDGAQA